MVERVESVGVTGPYGTRESHWDAIYESARPQSLRWYEPVPSTLDLVLGHSAPFDAVIDVGGGASRLTAELFARGYRNLTVLDLSETALVRGRHVLGAHAARVTWLHTDVTRFVPGRRWSLWHDRAVYHFLVDPLDRLAYRAAAATAIEPGGCLIISTFAPDGPETCAGLPVRRYDQLGLAAAFADDFELIDGASFPAASGVGDQRPYVAVVLRRRS